MLGSDIPLKLIPWRWFWRWHWLQAGIVLHFELVAARASFLSLDCVGVRLVADVDGTERVYSV
jgi:hypothetical protein